MVDAGVTGMEFLAVNTDIQSLQSSSADVTIPIGEVLTRGLGAGADPDQGRAAALESYEVLKDELRGRRHDLSSRSDRGEAPEPAPLRSSPAWRASSVR